MRIENAVGEGCRTHRIFGVRRCSCCSKYIGMWSSRSFWTEGGVDYCKECAQVKFKICECCNKIVDKLRSVDGTRVCSNCFRDKISRCSECGALKITHDLWPYRSGAICYSCYRTLNRSFRIINIGQRKVSSQAFVKNSKKGYCGVEIECLNEYKNENCFISKELRGFRFSQGQDNSLDGDGVEFRSVPMNGDVLFDSIERFCEELNRKEYEVDGSCGLHVHLEVKQQLEYLKKLYLFYLRFEDMFFNMLPKSRRKNDTCERFKKYYKDTPEEIMEVKTFDGFKEMLYGTRYYRGEIRDHYYRKRYCWANLHSIFYRGTLEIRSHSGTINSSKIINWIMIHQGILEFLEKKSLEEIGTMKVTKKAFLEIFPKPLQNYIQKRWKVFIHLEEKDLRTRRPVYTRMNLPNVENKDV